MQDLKCIAEHFVTWGGLYQMVVTLTLGGITVWIMFKQLQNKRMMKELSEQTITLGKQTLLLSEIYMPYLILNGDDNLTIDGSKTIVHSYLCNVGRPLFNLYRKPPNNFFVVFENSPELSAIYKLTKDSKIPVSFTFDSSNDPIVTLYFFDSQGQHYEQEFEIDKNNRVFSTGSKPIDSPKI